jgi:pimeloyl-ACP methyl ester carboxylesterase
MSVTEARGVTFHTQELGPPAPDAPGVVMIHGLFTGSLAAWYFTAAPEIARFRRVLLYDLRGHGRSERTPSGYDLATMAGDLDALAAAFQGQAGAPLDLIGHSYGALVALRFALDHPARVRRLALVEAPLPPSRFGELDAFAARAPAEMAEALPEGLRAALGHAGRRGARLVESLRFLAEDSSLLADLRAEPDVPDDALARVSCPVLCVYGDRSICRPVGDRLARALPDARLVVLPGGHYLHLDASAALTAALVEFLDG